MSFDAVILGSGLGGLQCAFILAKNGMKVCVLEKNAALGGCLQSFKRGTDEFDTGFHYVGALDKGQILERIFRGFGLMDLPWHRLDADGFDQIILGGRSYLLKNGYAEYAEGLSDCFPQRRAEIHAFAGFLKDVGLHITEPLTNNGGDYSTTNPLFESNASDFLRSSLHNSLLEDVVSGASLKIELNRNSLPLYPFAQINSSYIQSAWRLRGRGSMIADTLAEGIRKMGGCIMSCTEAVSLIEKDGKITGVEVEGRTPSLMPDGRKEILEASLFVSDLSPQLTLGLLKETSAVRPVFRRRICRLEQTYGFFTVNLKIKGGKIPYLNRNVYWYSPDLDSVWDVAAQAEKGNIKGLLITQQVPSDGSPYASQMDILAPMDFSQVEQWQNTLPMRRGSAYNDFKARRAEECIRLAENVFPNLGQFTEKVFTSTPLTYRNYTGAIRGSAYGIRKDCNNLTQTLLTTRTPLPNLFFTGQNLNLHGVLGVSITSLMTCSRILGKDKVVSFLE